MTFHNAMVVISFQLRLEQMQNTKSCVRNHYHAFCLSKTSRTRIIIIPTKGALSSVDGKKIQFTGIFPSGAF